MRAGLYDVGDISKLCDASFLATGIIVTQFVAEWVKRVKGEQ